MVKENEILQAISPEATLREITKAIPLECLDNIIVIGSLAVGYHFFKNQTSMVVRTKDADCLLSPRDNALAAGIIVTEKLLADGWRFKEDKDWPEPGNDDTLDSELPAVRLYPPGSNEWFIEFLAVPESLEIEGMQHTRIKTRFGHFDRSTAQHYPRI